MYTLESNKSILAFKIELIYFNTLIRKILSLAASSYGPLEWQKIIHGFGQLKVLSISRHCNKKDICTQTKSNGKGKIIIIRIMIYKGENKKKAIFQAKHRADNDKIQKERALYTKAQWKKIKGKSTYQYPLLLLLLHMDKNPKFRELFYWCGSNKSCQKPNYITLFSFKIIQIQFISYCYCFIRWVTRCFLIFESHFGSVIFKMFFLVSVL